MAADMADVEWDGIRHWKTWALAALDICISTTKCRPTAPHGRMTSLRSAASSLPVRISHTFALRPEVRLEGCSMK